MSKPSRDPETDGEELLARVKALLAKEGQASAKLTPEEEIENYLLPALDKFRDTQRFIYEPFLYPASGFRKFKNLVLNKIGNVSRNVVEKSVMRQQRFNDSVYTMLIHLYEENQNLRARLEKLEQTKAKHDRN